MSYVGQGISKQVEHQNLQKKIRKERCVVSARCTVRVLWIWELRIYMLKESPRDTKAESPGELVFGNYRWKVSALLMMTVVVVIDTYW